MAELRDWMRDVYAPAVASAPDPVGRERYARWSRYFNGTDLDLDEAYAYGWSEYHRLLAEMKTEAAKILPGAGPWEALKHLDEHGTHIEGVDEVQAWLQGLMDEAIENLDGTHFELAERVKKVESKIAPPGGAAAPYYTNPSEDFSRPGRTWLPTMGQTRFPVYDLVSTWYHEGVPGHHLQLAQWTHVADQLSRYQAGVGLVSANAEGWALYAERLMDELGYLKDPEQRLGYLDCQMMRAARVIVDIGMHLGLEIPADSPFHPGERWTVDLAQEFFGLHSGRGGLHRERADPLPVDARAGDRLQAGRAGLAAGPGQRAGRARRFLRPEGLAHGGAVAGFAGAGRPGGGALEALIPTIPTIPTTIPTIRAAAPRYGRAARGVSSRSRRSPWARSADRPRRAARCPARSRPRSPRGSSTRCRRASP